MKIRLLQFNVQLLGIFSNSSNPLLEYCLDGGYLKDLDPENREILPPILELCSQLSGFEPPTSDEDDLLTSESFEERLEHLCQSGCDINVRSAQGYTALHFLINGKIRFAAFVYIKAHNTISVSPFAFTTDGLVFVILLE
jgi:hypothetical protein